MPAAAFELWLDELEAHEATAARLVLGAPDQSARWVADRFGRVLQACAAAVLGTQVEVDVLARSQLAASSKSPPDAAPEDARACPLNPEHTFERFVIGEGNRLAHAAALTVAELPGQAYNPLFMCGPPGVGKTHLLHSIAAYVTRFGEGSVLCLTADEFTTGFVRALRRGAIDSFKAAYRSADVLLVDDVQFLQDKTRTEEELFHTFNALYEGGSQLVFTSDRPPRDINALEDRLRERFESGLVAEVQAPDFDTRLTILRRWTRHEGASAMDVGLLELLAERVTGNVRALRGALTRVIAQASLRGDLPAVEVVEEMLSDARTAGQRPTPTIAEVQQATCRACAITPEELLSSSRAARLAGPRQLAMYLSRRHTGATLPAIAREFGGRDHTTILYACRQAESRLEREPAVRKLARRIEAELERGTGDRSD